METELSSHRLTFIRLWTHVAKKRMNPLTIVPSMGPLKDAPDCFFPRRLGTKIHMLLFDGTKEIFNYAVIPGVTFAAHAATYFVKL